MRIALGIFFFMIAAYAFTIDFVGNHGLVMFRPWMREDWIIWGIIVLFFIAGAVLLVSGIIRLRRKKI